MTILGQPRFQFLAVRVHKNAAILRHPDACEIKYLEFIYWMMFRWNSVEYNFFVIRNFFETFSDCIRVQHLFICVLIYLFVAPYPILIMVAFFTLLFLKFLPKVLQMYWVPLCCISVARLSQSLVRKNFQGKMSSNYISIGFVL